MKKILLVDDDIKICDITKKYLVHAGYEVNVAYNGNQAKKLLEAERFNFAIFDVMLPDTTGFDLLTNLKDGIYMMSSNSTDKDIPVILLTALGQTQNVLQGLRKGADDYITKPFEPAELIERINVILRRTGVNTSNELSIGNILIDLDKTEVKCNNTQIVFQRREYDLLVFLCKNKNKVFSREELLNKVWTYEYDCSDRAVDICIQRVRSKLNEVNTGVNIKTIWGIGYKLECDINEKTNII